MEGRAAELSWKMREAFSVVELIRSAWFLMLSRLIRLRSGLEAPSHVAGV